MASLAFVPISRNMPTMRFVLLLLLALLAAPALAQTLPNHFDPSAREEVPNLAAVPAIRFLTTTDFPPFNYRDPGGALVGYHIDLARALCDAIEITCTVQAWPWDQIGNALDDNQGDALIAGLALTPENGERFDFSQIYLALPGRFVTRTPQTAAFDPAELVGRPVAVRAGSAHETFVRRYLPGAEVKTFETEPEALTAVQDGAADAYFGDGMRAAFWLNEHSDCCGFAGDPYFRPDLFGSGLAIAVRAGQDAVRAAINTGLLRLKRDGVLDELYLRWFPVGFY
jgi:polar amino acid transport system substrate-binding protein